MNWLMSDDIERDMAVAESVLETLRQYGEVSLLNGKQYKLELKKTDDPSSPYVDTYVPSDQNASEGRPVSFEAVLTVS